MKLLLLVSLLLTSLAYPRNLNRITIEDSFDQENNENITEEELKQDIDSSELNKDGYHEFLDKKNDTKLELKAALSTGFFQAQNSNFGAGTQDAKNPNIVSHNVFWSEYIVSPKARVTQRLSNKSIFYSKLSLLLAATRGKGEASAVATTANRPTYLNYEELAAGWKSGDLTKTENLIDFSFGQQCFSVGDSFLIAQGTWNAYNRGAFFYSPRSAFKNTAILTVNTSPIRGQLFHLQTNTNQKLLKNTDQPKTSLYGTNIEYVSIDPEKPSTEYWTIGITLLNLYKAETYSYYSYAKNRNGLMVFNPRLGGNFFPQDRNIRFFAGYVYQKNDKQRLKTRANAYYIEPGYTFKNIWGSPLLYYRYSHYSGDRNSDGKVKKSYDPLTSGLWARDGYGTWETAEIQGYLYFSNTNQNVHNVHLKFTPSDQHIFGVQYFIINFDKPQQYSVQSKSGSREIDLYYTWNPNPKFSLTAMTGMLTPKSGVKEYTTLNSPNANPSRIGKNIYFFGLMLNYTL